MTLPDPQLQPEFYANVPLKRALAWLVDTVLILLLALIAVIFTLFVGAFIFPVLFAAVSIGYRTVMLARFGATFGMMLGGIRLFHLDGRNPDPATAAIYSVLHAGVMFFVITQIASIVTILVTPYRQGLHDLALGTTMLNRPADI
ncbi:RDD family protein [Rhodobacteraceae bacterium 2376]|uniref:RDD family protein n=1 Tax=Rhabdonatronobacter sediminivivens TaxID=2743469 RepID=A0A7Z0HXH7_9RHOB|nr:RDD family protein [Rhabdonatronobacter sediminivivens]NYS24108.1 RDD family protein [Rhabdonatronobacter sediminivivens]